MHQKNGDKLEINLKQLKYNNFSNKLTGFTNKKTNQEPYFLYNEDYNNLIINKNITYNVEETNSIEIINNQINAGSWEKELYSQRDNIIKEFLENDIVKSEGSLNEFMELRRNSENPSSKKNEIDDNAYKKVFINCNENNLKLECNENKSKLPFDKLNSKLDNELDSDKIGNLSDIGYIFSGKEFKIYNKGNKYKKKIILIDYYINVLICEEIKK